MRITKSVLCAVCQVRGVQCAVSKMHMMQRTRWTLCRVQNVECVVRRLHCVQLPFTITSVPILSPVKGAQSCP